MINFVKKHREINELYISNSTVNTIIDKYISEIVSNEKTILQMYNIDTTKTNQRTDIKKIVELLKKYKDEKTSMATKKKVILASYYGTPYITINLCIQALLQKNAYILAIQDDMLAINKALVSIFNTILEEYKITELVKIYNLPSKEQIKTISNNVDEVICIGNSNIYNQYRKMNIDVNFIPFKNMAIYCEDIQYEEIQYSLYNYATTNGIEVEVYDDMELDDFIECMELEQTIENVVILTKKEENKDEIKNKLKGKKIYINKNPFKDECFKMDNCN